MMLRLSIGLTLCVLSQFIFSAERENALVFVGTGEKQFKESKYDSAKEMAERALSADGTCAAAHLLMAQCLEQLGKPRDAMRSYRSAIASARKDKDAITERKASDAARKCAPGLLDIAMLDQKLIDKLGPLADKAFDDKQYDTAKTAYQTVLALDPENLKAKEGVSKVEKVLAERGDPIRLRIASAMLAEVWYYVGNQRKEQAAKVAKELATNLGDTAPGRDAEILLANDFGLPKDLRKEMAVAKAELKQLAKTAAPVADIKPVGTPASTPTPRPVASKAPSTGVDVEQMERVYGDEAKKCPKEKLAESFKDALTKGKEHYSGATPGTEGNQKKVASALEQFIRCEAYLLRMEEEKLVDGELQKLAENASMLRYACMKMTILNQ